MGIKKFTPREKKFIDRYIITCNGARAAREAGYSHKSAVSVASENLRKPHIAKAIKAKREELQIKYDISKDKVLAELASIAFSRPKAYASWNNENVTVSPSDELEEGQDAAIKKLKRVCSEHGVNIELEFHGKIESLNLLCKILGFINDGDPNKPTDPVFDEERIRGAVREIKGE